MDDWPVAAIWITGIVAFFGTIVVGMLIDGGVL